MFVPYPARGFRNVYNPSHQGEDYSEKTYISCTIDKSCPLHELEGLKPEWLSQIKLFSLRNSNIEQYKVLSNIFPITESRNIDLQLSIVRLYPFLLTGTILDFFHISGKIPDSMQGLYIIDKGLMIAPSLIFILTDNSSSGLFLRKLAANVFSLKIEFK